MNIIFYLVGAATEELRILNLESKLFSSFLKKSKLCDGCLRRALGTHRCSRCRDARFCSQVELQTNLHEVFAITEKAGRRF